MYVLITPIEIASTLIFRPFTLAVRLFANMFAGHLLLVIFALGTVYLLQVGNFSVIFAPVSFVMAIITAAVPKDVRFKIFSGSPRARRRARFRFL